MVTKMLVEADCNKIYSKIFPIRVRKSAINRFTTSHRKSKQIRNATLLGKVNGSIHAI